jgi:DNA-binding response OmpR family regulator
VGRILIFDGYPSIRELLAEELAADGYTVIPIANRESIEGFVAALEPDLLILDPLKDGTMKWEIVDDVKVQNPTLPILLFTGWCQQGPGFSKADACLPKSYNFDKLKEKIKEILQKKLWMERGSEATSIPGSRKKAS